MKQNEKKEEIRKTKQAKNKAQSLIDTSNMSEGQRAALELAESSRDKRAITGFAGSLFMGEIDYTQLFPFPSQNLEDRDQGNAFLRKLETFLEEKTDPDAIDREGEIPDSVIEGLAELGAFGIKIPTKYGGLGLSQTNYSRAAMKLGAHCGNLTALLSAHQSIGMPQPLIVFGTAAQKNKFLPACAKGSISAFALTEENVGSDPARMTTVAALTEDGEHWILKGEKLWCTNGLKADHIVVMARTPMEGNRHATTAFIVNTEWEGVEIINRCRFMGLKALYNGIIRFNEVKIPRENVIHDEGKGLKVALTTLNTGRLTLPAACAGMMKRCLEISLDWSKNRTQWGNNIGKHAAIAGKIADIAADAFATESMVLYVSSLVDQDKKADIRIEAAMAKLWGTEAAWHAVDQTMQIKGGRGYETADSLKNRGAKADPIERLLRDCRINTIFEGSTEIMKLFIAREALDPHLRQGAAAIDTRNSLMQRAKAGIKAGLFYSLWYPGRYIPQHKGLEQVEHPKLNYQLKQISKQSRRLSRALFHSMVKIGPQLEKRQLLLGRYVDIATELFAMTCSVARAHALDGCDDNILNSHAVENALYICKRGNCRIEHLFKEAKKAPDKQGYDLAQSMLREL